jgi:hypothetical protein
MIKQTRPRRRTIWIAVGVLLAFGLTPACKRSAPENTPTASNDPSQLATAMIGAWVHVGQPGNVHEPPIAGQRLKFRTGKHWTLVRADPTTGLVVEQFGGTYTLKGTEYVETQQYADERWIKDNGKSFKFTVKVEGDTMTQLGMDNPYNEIWKRAK